MQFEIYFIAVKLLVVGLVKKRAPGFKDNLVTLDRLVVSYHFGTARVSEITFI